MAYYLAMKTAVLVIDVQQGLCEGEGQAFEARHLIFRINQVIRKARSAGAVVVMIQHESSSGALGYDSPGWQLAQGLHVEAGDFYVRKSTPDSFLHTNLAQLLQHADVENLVICGLQTEYCVDTTTRRALALGYPVTLVEDGHSTAGSGVLTPEQVIAHHNVVLSQIESFGPRVTLVSAEALEFAPSQT